MLLSARYQSLQPLPDVASHVVQAVAITLTIVLIDHSLLDIVTGVLGDARWR